MDDDFMEIGSGLVGLPNGWYIEKETGNRVDPEGNVFNIKGECIWSPDIVDPDDEGYDR